MDTLNTVLIRITKKMWIVISSIAKIIYITKPINYIKQFVLQTTGDVKSRSIIHFQKRIRNTALMKRNVLENPKHQRICSESRVLSGNSILTEGYKSLNANFIYNFLKRMHSNILLFHLHSCRIFAGSRKTKLYF